MWLRKPPPESMTRRARIFATVAQVFIWTWAAASAWATWRVIEDTGHLKLTASRPGWHPGAIALMVIALLGITTVATLATGWLWLAFLELNPRRSTASVRSKAWMYTCITSTVGGLAMCATLAYRGRTLSMAAVILTAIGIGLWIGIPWTRKTVFRGGPGFF